MLNKFIIKYMTVRFKVIFTFSVKFHVRTIICATTQVAHTAGAPQVIDVKENLTVHLYDSLTTLRAAYMYQGGDAGKINEVLGFYSETGNSIHCLKWDFKLFNYC